MRKTFTPRKPKRLETRDYSQQGYYYVTICTYQRFELFGTIEGNNMVLNQFGQIAQNTWLDLPNHHKNIKLDEFIVMPNHIHGILNVIVGARPASPSNMPARSYNKNYLSIIIGSYKSSVSRQINRFGEFKWQRSFHDYVIRTSNRSLYNIRKYIKNNPANWDNDDNNIKNHKVKGQAGLAPTIAV